MNKFFIIGIIIATIIGIISIIFVGTLIENAKEVMESTPESPEKTSENESIPQGRNLSIEFDEEMGLSAP